MSDWKPPTPKQFLSMMADNDKFIESYLKANPFEIIESDKPFEIGDFVCYKNFIYGDFPCIVTLLRKHHISCHLIDHLDRTTAWIRMDEVKHIRLIQQKTP